ncbi:hypothetical protein ACB092_09G199500 [Castanea dentata]
MSDNNNSVRWGSLPDEILTHIFVFRPFKSIIICTSISKELEIQLSFPPISTTPTTKTSFSSASIHKFTKYLMYCITKMTLDDADEITITCKITTINPHFTQHFSFDYPFHVPFRVVGICDGLLCLFEDLHFFSISVEPLC